MYRFKKIQVESGSKNLQKISSIIYRLQVFSENIFMNKQMNTKAKKVNNETQIEYTFGPCKI